MGFASSYLSSQTTFGSCEKVCNRLLQLERHLPWVEQKWNEYANELLPQDLCLTFKNNYKRKIFHSNYHIETDMESRTIIIITVITGIISAGGGGGTTTPDPTVPVIEANIDGRQGRNGWYTSEVVDVSWKVNDRESG